MVLQMAERIGVHFARLRTPVRLPLEQVCLGGAGGNDALWPPLASKPLMSFPLGKTLSSLIEGFKFLPFHSFRDVLFRAMAALANPAALKDELIPPDISTLIYSHGFLLAPGGWGPSINLVLPLLGYHHESIDHFQPALLQNLLAGLQLPTHERIDRSPRDPEMRGELRDIEP